MQKDRGQLRDLLLLMLKDLGYDVDPPFKEYAEEQFDVHFTNCHGGQDHLKPEINYLERLPVAGTLRKELSTHLETLVL